MLSRGPRLAARGGEEKELAVPRVVLAREQRVEPVLSVTGGPVMSKIVLRIR